MAEKKIKVLIIDDSALVRKLLTQVLQRDRSIDVVGTAMDAYMAREKIKKLNPDVLTLDVEMPRMDGLTFLRNLMKLRPMPVVMVSTLTEKGASVTLDALAYGAVDFVAKPKLDFANTIEEYAAELLAKVKMAAGARVRQYSAPALATPQERYSVDRVIDSLQPRRRHFRTTDKIIAIGASTGGTEAIKEILMALPLSCPGIVVAQHIPENFSKPFANRLNACCGITVTQAGDGDIIMPGRAYIAPGGRHLLVVRDGTRWRCRLSDEVPVNRHRPSVDVLFRSVANAAGANATGVILTGMGRDGAQGLLDMRNVGALTLAQDESSSVVWGMPGSAVEMGAADEVLPLHRLAGRLVEELGLDAAAKAAV